MSSTAEALAATSLTLARRFSGGATLWCWSPATPSDAAHVAVEFVHPVIVGKRALPAVAVPRGQGADFLRASARAGDALVAIGPGDDPAIRDVVVRAPAWGLDVVWLSVGVEPPSELAAHVVWLGPTAGAADVVCAYHLLWELTHVCLEHPGVLVTAEAGPTSCPACMDAGELGEVQHMPSGADGAKGCEASVLVAGEVQSVDLSLVDTCAPGELVLVHAGVAIAKIAGADRG